MSKKLLQFLYELESRQHDLGAAHLALFIRELFPEGAVCDNHELNVELDNLLNLVKEAKNKLKSKRSYRDMSVEDMEGF